MPAESFAEFGRIAGIRFTALPRQKLVAAMLCNFLFWSAYLLLSRDAVSSIHHFQLTSLDGWAGYRPGVWGYVYESNFLLVGLCGWLVCSREELWRYVYGFALLSLASFTVFLLFPVASPRPAQSLDTSRFLLFITRVDGPLNAFPSLHASSLVYALLFARRAFGRTLPISVAGFGLVWAALILFATLATKQHYAIDLAAGVFLGAVSDSLAWSRFGAPSTASLNKARTSGITSQTG